MALTLHMPGTLDLIMKGALAGRTFSGSVVLSVMNQLNAIIATDASASICIGDYVMLG